MASCYSVRVSYSRSLATSGRIQNSLAAGATVQLKIIGILLPLLTPTFDAGYFSAARNYFRFLHPLKVIYKD